MYSLFLKICHMFLFWVNAAPTSKRPKLEDFHQPLELHSIHRVLSAHRAQPWRWSWLIHLLILLHSPVTPIRGSLFPWGSFCFVARSVVVYPCRVSYHFLWSHLCLLSLVSSLWFQVFGFVNHYLWFVFLVFWLLFFVLFLFPMFVFLFVSSFSIFDALWFIYFF